MVFVAFGKICSIKEFFAFFVLFSYIFCFVLYGVNITSMGGADLVEGAGH